MRVFYISKMTQAMIDARQSDVEFIVAINQHLAAARDKGFITTDTYKNLLSQAVQNLPSLRKESRDSRIQ